MTTMIGFGLENEAAGQRFLEQNDSALEGMTAEDLATVDMFSQHHAGGLYVVLCPLSGERYVKVHDTWGDPDDPDEGAVVVHTYPDDDVREGDDDDVVEYFPTMHDALARFGEIIGSDDGEW